jgi:hypothetical protein
MDDDFDEEDEDDMDLPSEFASADEFAEMLQETGASSLDVAGSNVMENQDNAGKCFSSHQIYYNFNII